MFIFTHYNKPRLKYIFPKDIRAFVQSLLDKKVLKSKQEPMGHVAHLKKKMFKSIYTYDYIITLIRRNETPLSSFLRIRWNLIRTNLNPLNQRMLCAKFG